MIRKIICPTDFSEAANNAILYGAKLAQAHGAELLLVHVAYSPLGISDAEAGTIELALSRRCAELNKLFRISADYDVSAGTDSLADHIASARQDNALIVMGTNGRDTLFQRFFGANTYRVIRKTNCPVLVVPEKVEYRSIRKIVFTWNYTRGERHSFTSLHELTIPFSPRYTLLHVSTHRPEIAKEVFRALRHEAEDQLGSQAELHFEQVFASNVPGSIDEFMRHSESDLLAITYFNRKMLQAFFHGKILKNFIGHVTYPILVLHG